MKRISTGTPVTTRGALVAETVTHEPWPVTVETFEDVGGVKISEGATVQIRCGCRGDLLYDYGHEAA